MVIAFAGGGGSSSSSGGGGGGSYGGYGGGYHSYSSGNGNTVPVGTSSANDVMWGVAAFIIIVVILMIVRTAVLRKKKSAAAIQPPGIAPSIAPPADPRAFAESVYLRYQSDWENYDLTSMRSYMSDVWYQRNELMVTALQELHRKNSIREVTISSLTLNPEGIDGTDRFSATYAVSATDALIDTRDDKQLYLDGASVNETYNFVRAGTDWKLDSVDESTALGLMQNQSIKDFAAQHGLFYSLDWGRLLLPREGYLFGPQAFQSADINNHCIGRSHGLLIQIYTVTEETIGTYAVAQVGLPKSYGRIVVRHRHTLQLPISGLTRITTEWADFNEKYDVYASDAERATSFELLNPGFMQRLEGYSDDINIEVVDTIVYLYSRNIRNSPSQYETMLSVLEEAFKELKL